ncbi:hypothetical protein SteCoe_16485 [Stentor coeruleus]|uniref:Uncharacterized protein n=1 Tax=Stentor coeruleus TaxID=5963 RepID=A0A1R2C155_9CILI|nr:hypothetical protein SteCoe_16485 [Stentor coeruleus]
MSIFEQIELEDKVMKICKILHGKLCEDADDTDESIMNSDEVNALEPVEALSHMTEAIKDLLSHQRNLKIFSEHKSFHNSEIVQTTLQKLEADIREHIKIENQLKLYCESLESNIEENEIANMKIETSIKDKTGELDKENHSLKQELLILEEELVKLKGNRKTETSKENDVTREPEAEIQAESEHKNVILVDKCLKVKRLKEIAKNKEFLCKELTKENKEMVDLIKKTEGEKNDMSFPTVSYFKMQYKEKCKEINNLKNKLKGSEKPTVKSLSPYANTARNNTSSSPVTKRMVSKEIKKKSPLKTNTGVSKSLHRTMRNPLSKL